MLITKLSLTNFRAYTQAEFEFKEGLNLLVGINGAGKTTVLEAIRVCLSIILPNLFATKQKKESFADTDIKNDAEYLQVVCRFTYKRNEYELLIVKYRENRIQLGNKKDAKTINIKDKETFTPDFKPGKTEVDTRSLPIGVYFSTKRSLITEKTAGLSAALNGQAAAYAEALSENRAFNLRIFSEWYKALVELAKEVPILLNGTYALKQAMETFLPQFNNIRVETVGDLPQFVIDKNGISLNLHQLSDGEKGILALVLDITKRLYQANFPSTLSLKGGNGVVLIDELDLHLHPKWQRSIVANLQRVFPNCQFIASTHSPQIIGEVKPEFITIIDNVTYKPSGSFGIDSSRLLEELLDTPARNEEVETLLAQLNQSIDEEKLDEAKAGIQKLIVILGQNDPEIIRSNTMIHFLEDELTNETNTKG